jgi:1-acyl-sn-glycerol-3-phosphate acyltransferase
VTIRKGVRRAVRVAGFAAGAAGVLPLHAAHERLVAEDARDELKERYKRAWCEAMLRLFDVTVVLHGDVPPPGNRGRLIVVNHRSAIDIVVMFRVFGGHMLSRADISGWPVFGAIARRIGTVFVDRESKRSGASAIRDMTELLAAGRTVTVFAEGTTFEGDDVRPFHRGGFSAAARADAEVLPVGLVYEASSEAAFHDETFLAHLGRVAASPASRVHVAVGSLIAPDAARSVGETTELARSRVALAVREARHGDGVSVAGARTARPR